jgi:hypothetical protein
MCGVGPGCVRATQLASLAEINDRPALSAFPSTADIRRGDGYVSFVPQADMRGDGIAQGAPALPGMASIGRQVISDP